MDILALKSTVISSPNLIYCNLRVSNSLGVLISSSVVNFTDASNILIDFNSSNYGDDGEMHEDWSTSSTETFDIFISDCMEEVDCSISNAEVHMHPNYYVADPNRFKFEATFSSVSKPASNDLSFPLNLVARKVTLFKSEEFLEKGGTLNNFLNPNAEQTSAMNSQYLFSRPCHETLRQGIQAYGLPGANHKNKSNQINWDENILIWLYLASTWTLKFLARFYSGMLVTAISWIISHIQKHAAVSSFNGSATDSLLGSHDDELQTELLLDNEDGRLHSGRPVSNGYHSSCLLELSVEQEYYNMVENATGNSAVDYMPWGYDTESESDSSSYDVASNRSRSISSESAPRAERDFSQRINSVSLIDRPLSSGILHSSFSVLPIENTTLRNSKSPSELLTVDSVELAFLAEWQHLSLNVPGEVTSYDDSLQSKPILLHHSFGEINSPSPHDLQHGSSIVNSSSPHDLQPGLSVGSRREYMDTSRFEIHEEALSSTINVDVSISPTSQLKAAQACLTPSEWKSVNDMPRVNRRPFTNETQRITPLKDRVREHRKDKKKSNQSIMVRKRSVTADGFGSTMTEDVTSSNCSTVSPTLSSAENPLKFTGSGKYQATAVSTRDLFDNSATFQMATDFEEVECCMHVINSGGEKIQNDDDEENNNCNYSDISSRDEQFLDGNVESDQCSSNVESGDGSDYFGNNRQDLTCCGKDTYECESSSESDTDSDNDLGQFYTPSPQLNHFSNTIMSGPITISSSLGYISSYPSAGSKSDKTNTLR